MTRYSYIAINLLVALILLGCGSATPDTGAGEDLASSKGCLACHANGESSKIGPSWVGLFGSSVTLRDGSTIIADETYIEESILDPNAKIVQGYTPYSMPGINLSPEEVQSLVAFIKTIR